MACLVLQPWSSETSNLGRVRRHDEVVAHPNPRPDVSIVTSVDSKAEGHCGMGFETVFDFASREGESSRRSW
jgi:hypothetical protein